MKRGWWRTSGGIILLSLLLTWVSVSVHACGLTKSATFTGADLPSSLGNLLRSVATAGGSQAMRQIASYQTALTVAIVLVGLGGAISLVAGSWSGLPISAFGMLLVTYLISRLVHAAEQSLGIITVTYRVGYYIAWAGVAALLAGCFITEPNQRDTPNGFRAEVAVGRSCPTCGSSVGATDVFCRGCGGRL